MDSIRILTILLALIVGKESVAQEDSFESNSYLDSFRPAQIVYTVGISDTIAQVLELDPETSNFIEQVSFLPLSEDPPQEYREARGRLDTYYAVHVVEGTTNWQVITALNALDILEGELPDSLAEGTLAPGSYDLLPGTEVSAVLARMTSLQAQILAEAWAQRADGLPLESPEEALVLASIIEKETAVPDERRRVASVFINRLRQGIRLQTDPAVIYGVTGGQGLFDRGLRRSELTEPTPWNTYLIQGLPPTPISNPGRAAIEAALNPDATAYLFFVADGTGGHVFATTLDEHTRNVAAWRAIEALATEATDQSRLEDLSEQTARTALATEATDQALFDEALQLFRTAESLPADERRDVLLTVRRLLDQIISGYPSSDLNQALSAAETDAFRIAVQSCLTVRLGDPASMIAVTVRIELDRDGYVVNDVSLVRATEGSNQAVEEAFHAARRAILRCQGEEGYSLPLGSYDRWKVIELTIGPL